MKTRTFILLLNLFLLSNLSAKETKASLHDFLEISKRSGSNTILHDIGIEKGRYKHQYSLSFIDSAGNKNLVYSDWIYVSESFFSYHINDLGEVVDVYSGNDKSVSNYSYADTVDIDAISILYIVLLCLALCMVFVGMKSMV